MINNVTNKKNAHFTIDNQPIEFKKINQTTNMIIKEADYISIMARIDKLMSKGSDNVSRSELAEIKKLALQAQAYENKKFVINLPSTFAGIIEMKMYELSLKQTELAKKLHVSDAKLSLIMSGKQKPDVVFLKAVHTELNVDANLLLEAV